MRLLVDAGADMESAVPVTGALSGGFMLCNETPLEMTNRCLREKEIKKECQEGGTGRRASAAYCCAWRRFTPWRSCGQARMCLHRRSAAAKGPRRDESPSTSLCDAIDPEAKDWRQGAILGALFRWVYLWYGKQPE